MRLFGTPGSPYVRKVRIVLEEKRISHEYIVERASAPGSRVPQFNPLGKIPVLVLDDGRAIYDSPVIVEYLDALADGPRLIPDALDERIEVRRWEALADGVADATVAVSHEYRELKEKQRAREMYGLSERQFQRLLEQRAVYGHGHFAVVERAVRGGQDHAQIFRQRPEVVAPGGRQQHRGQIVSVQRVVVSQYALGAQEAEVKLDIMANDGHVADELL